MNDTIDRALQEARDERWREQEAINWVSPYAEVEPPPNRPPTREELCSLFGDKDCTCTSCEEWREREANKAAEAA